MNSSHTDQLSAAMRGSRNFRHGGGGGVGGWGGPRQSDKKTLTALFVCFCFFAFFLVLGLFYRGQMVNFKEKYQFSRFRGGEGPNFSRGGGGRGGNCLLPIETQITCDFPGGGVRSTRPLPSGSALGCDLFSFPVRKMMRSPLGLHMCSFSCNFVVCFQSSPVIKSFLELTA